MFTFDINPNLDADEKIMLQSLDATLDNKIRTTMQLIDKRKNL